MTGIEERLSEAFEKMEAEEARERPAREAREKRLAELRARSPRVIYRDPGSWGGRVSYQPLRLHDVGFQKAHVQKSYSLTGGKATKRPIPDRVVIGRHGGTRLVRPEDLDEYVRRPTSKALRRLEEAEAELARAKSAVEAAKRAAFTYGRGIPLATVKKAARERRAAYDG